MNILSGKLLASPRLTCNKHMAVSQRHFTQISLDLPNRQARPDQRLFRSGFRHGISRLKVRLAATLTFPESPAMGRERDGTEIWKLFLPPASVPEAREKSDCRLRFVGWETGTRNFLSQTSKSPMLYHPKESACRDLRLRISKLD